MAIYGPALFVIYYSLCLSLAEFVKREVFLLKTSLRPSVELRMVQDGWMSIREKAAKKSRQICAEVWFISGYAILQVSAHRYVPTLS